MRGGMSEVEWLPIRYGAFWDVPRLFHLHWRGSHLVFDCNFVDAADEYSPEYVVFSVPSPPPDRGSWQPCIDTGVAVGRIPVDQVRFDETRRRFVAKASIASVLGTL